jgi:hypothetical protein
MVLVPVGIEATQAMIHVRDPHCDAERRQSAMEQVEQDHGIATARYRDQHSSIHDAEPFKLTLTISIQHGDRIPRAFGASEGFRLKASDPVETLATAGRLGILGGRDRISSNADCPNDDASKLFGLGVDDAGFRALGRAELWSVGGWLGHRAANVARVGGRGTTL